MSVARAAAASGVRRQILAPAAGCHGRSDALLGMRPLFQYQLARGCCRWPDQSSILADTVDRPVTAAAMTRWHVVWNRGALPSPLERRWAAIHWP
jgi:hypothetical protein